MPRLNADFLAEQRASLGESWYRQEYECSFEARQGLVFPGLSRCLTTGPAPEAGQRVGGIDFGFRNPFAAVWGTLDRDDVLWLTGEHYQTHKPLEYHARRLPRRVLWYADPSGALEIDQLTRLDLKVRKGKNALRVGIASVTARIESQSLRILPGACPNLLREAALYRYPDDSQDESPEDAHNHALSALRYLIASLTPRRSLPPPRPDSDDRPPARRRWLSYYNEALWTRL